MNKMVSRWRLYSACVSEGEVFLLFIYRIISFPYFFNVRQTSTSALRRSHFGLLKEIKKYPMQALPDNHKILFNGSLYYLKDVGRR